MHNIKSIRKDPELFTKKFSDRNVKIKLDDLLNLDKLNRDLIEKKEKLEQEKKIISQKKKKIYFLNLKNYPKKLKLFLLSKLKSKMKLKISFRHYQI